MDTPTQNPRRAVLMILIASAFFAATTLLAKYLGTGENAFHPFQVSAGRFGFALLAIAGYLSITRPRIENVNYPLHAMRTLCGWAGVTLLFAAVARIPVSDATAISFLNPVFGMLLAIPLLGERVGPWRWVAAAVALIGALILLRPTPASFQPAALIALTAAVVMGLEVILIKKLSNREAPFQILLMSNTIGAAIAFTTASFVWITPTPDQWIAMAALGFIMAAGQALFIQAMRAGEASFVLPFFYATLVFATLYDLWIYGVIPDAISIIGATIIVAGALLLAWRETVNRTA